MFDVTIQVADMQAVTVAPEEDQSGHVIVALIVGLSLPGLPPGALIPVGAVRTLMGRGAAIENAEKLRAAAEELPEEKPHSDLVLATDLRGVDRAAAMAEQFRGGTAG